MLVRWAACTTSSTYIGGADSGVDISEDQERPNLNLVEAWARTMLVRTLLFMRVLHASKTILISSLIG